MINLNCFFKTFFFLFLIILTSCKVDQTEIIDQSIQVKIISSPGYYYLKDHFVKDTTIKVIYEVSKTTKGKNLKSVKLYYQDSLLKENLIDVPYFRDTIEFKISERPSIFKIDALDFDSKKGYSGISFDNSPDKFIVTFDSLNSYLRYDGNRLSTENLDSAILHPNEIYAKMVYNDTSIFMISLSALKTSLYDTTALFTPWATQNTIFKTVLEDSIDYIFSYNEIYDQDNLNKIYNRSNFSQYNNNQPGDAIGMFTFTKDSTTYYNFSGNLGQYSHIILLSNGKYGLIESLSLSFHNGIKNQYTIYLVRNN